MVGLAQSAGVPEPAEAVYPHVFFFGVGREANSEEQQGEESTSIRSDTFHSSTLSPDSSSQQVGLLHQQREGFTTHEAVGESIWSFPSPVSSPVRRRGLCFCTRRSSIALWSEASRG